MDYTITDSTHTLLQILFYLVALAFLLVVLFAPYYKVGKGSITPREQPLYHKIYSTLLGVGLVLFPIFEWTTITDLFGVGRSHMLVSILVVWGMLSVLLGFVGSILTYPIYLVFFLSEGRRPEFLARVIEQETQNKE